MRVYKLLQLVCSHHVSPGSVRWSQPGSPTFGNQEGVSFALFLLFLKVNTNSQMESPKVKVAQSCPTLCDPMDSYSPWNSPGQNTGVGSHSLLQGILPTQGSNPGLPHCRRILYQLSHKEGPISWVKTPRGPTLLLHVILQVSHSKPIVSLLRWLNGSTCQKPTVFRTSSNYTLACLSKSCFLSFAVCIGWEFSRSSSSVSLFNNSIFILSSLIWLWTVMRNHFTIRYTLHQMGENNLAKFSSTLQNRTFPETFLILVWDPNRGISDIPICSIHLFKEIYDFSAMYLKFLLASTHYPNPKPAFRYLLE